MKFSLYSVGIEPDHISRHVQPHHGVFGTVAPGIVLAADLSPGTEDLRAGVVPGLVNPGDTAHLVQDLNRLSVCHASDSRRFLLISRCKVILEIGGKI